MQDPTIEHDGRVRETFERFEVGETMIGMIADPHTPDAWLQSNVFATVEA